MRKKLSIYLSIMLLGIFLLLACGNTTKKELVPYEGKWVAVVAEMFGCRTGIEESVGGAMELDLKSNGDVQVTIGDDEGKASCSVEGNQFTLVIDGEEMKGIIDGDTIVFDDMLGMGLKVIFAKDGTDAMNPDLYLSEDQKAIMGQWQSVTVEEILGDGPKTSFPGVDDIHDALRLNFKADNQVEIIYKGESIGSYSWDIALGICTIDSDNPLFLVMMNEDNTMNVTYSTDDDYYDFICEKVE